MSLRSLYRSLLVVIFLLIIQPAITLAVDPNCPESLLNEYIGGGCEWNQVIRGGPPTGGTPFTDPRFAAQCQLTMFQGCGQYLNNPITVYRQCDALTQALQRGCPVVYPHAVSTTTSNIGVFPEEICGPVHRISVPRGVRVIDPASYAERFCHNSGQIIAREAEIILPPGRMYPQNGGGFKYRCGTGGGGVGRFGCYALSAVTFAQNVCESMDSRSNSNSILACLTGNGIYRNSCTPEGTCLGPRPGTVTCGIKGCSCGHPALPDGMVRDAQNRGIYEPPCGWKDRLPPDWPQGRTDCECIGDLQNRGGSVPINRGCPTYVVLQYYIWTESYKCYRGD